MAGDAELRRALDSEDWSAVESNARRLLFAKPEGDWDLDKLQIIYKTDRVPTLREILSKVLGLAPSIPTRNDLADEAFERFVATEDVPAVHGRRLRTFFTAYLLDPESRALLEEGQFGALRARDARLFGAVQQIPPDERVKAVGYLRSNVNVKQFEAAP